jgi:hypothetical protein
MSQRETPTYRYGDFPELFQDLRPEVEVDRDDPLIITRVLREGNLSHVQKLIRTDVLRRELDNLELPYNIRSFWTLVLMKLGERETGTNR